MAELFDTRLSVSDLAGRGPASGFQTGCMAYNLGNFLRTLAITEA
jgi:hypothetical protein